MNEERCGDKHHNKNNKMGLLSRTGSKGRYVTEETKRKISISKKGENNPNYGKNGELNTNWRGGISFDPYCWQFNKKLKDEIKIKHNYICFNCKEQYDSGNLCIHHIDYDKNDLCNGKKWSLLPLCRKCNSSANFNRWWWFNKLMNYWILNEEINWNIKEW